MNAKAKAEMRHTYRKGAWCDTCRLVLSSTSAISSSGIRSRMSPLRERANKTSCAVTRTWYCFHEKSSICLQTGPSKTASSGCSSRGPQPGRKSEREERGESRLSAGEPRFAPPRTSFKEWLLLHCNLEGVERREIRPTQFSLATGAISCSTVLEQLYLHSFRWVSIPPGLWLAAFGSLNGPFPSWPLPFSPFLRPASCPSAEEGDFHINSLSYQLINLHINSLPYRLTKKTHIHLHSIIT